MLRKIALAGSAIALLASSHVRLRISNETSDGSVAWAQTPEDSNSETSGDATGDVASEPDAESSPPFDVAGTWVGRSSDKRYGATGLDLTIRQHGHQLKGFWVFLLGEGNFAGQIVGDTLSFRLRRKGNGGRGCNLLLDATLVSNTKMTGTYSIARCKPADIGIGAGGTVDFTKD